MEQIHARTTEIFADLADLAGVVVLFDEMDALAAKRGGSTQLDVVRQLLTTGMLPKLADLFRRKQIVYFMNTNHRKDIDPAIMRAGRFDMLLHVVPPTWDDKLNGLRLLYRAEKAEITKAEAILKDFTQHQDKEREILDRFTFSELKSFLEHVQMSREGEQLSGKLNGWNKDGFLRLVDDWGSKFIVLKDGSPELEEFNEDQSASALQ
jgi:SpoVK/Ycf46/Vps4 family AAA+-type ATPase